MPKGAKYQKIIDYSGLSKTALEKLLGLGNGTIGQSIKRNSNIKEATLDNISKNFPEFSLVWLYKDHGPMLKKDCPPSSTDSPDNQMKEPSDIYLKNGLPDHVVPHYAPLLPAKAYATYLKTSDKEAFLADLDFYTLTPGVRLNGKGIYFEVSWNDMKPEIKEGDHLLCSSVPVSDWSMFRDGYMYVIVTESEILLRRASRGAGKEWILHANNKTHQPSTINTEQVKELWMVHRHIKNHIPPPKEVKLI